VIFTVSVKCGVSMKLAAAAAILIAAAEISEIATGSGATG